MWSTDEVIVDYVGEGMTDASVARALIRAAGGHPGTNFVAARRGRGKDNLDGRLAGLNRRASLGSPVLALRDLDRDEPCPAALVARLVAQRAPLFHLRIPVPSVESWLMADRDAFARAIGVRVSTIPVAPDKLTQAKGSIATIASASRKRDVRADLLPRPGSGISEGPALGAWLSRFATNEWSPQRAVRVGNSPSLCRAFARLAEMVERFGNQT